jgi:hypothetical protein
MQWKQADRGYNWVSARTSVYSAMADPLTIGLLATLFINKAFEKSGEKLGEGFTKKVGEVIAYLLGPSPKVAEALEAEDATVLNWGMATLEPIRAEPIFAELRAEAEENPEFKEKLEALKAGGTVNIIGKQINISQGGSRNTQTNTFSNF